MAELWPFIQLLVKKWQLEGRNFTFGGLLLKLAMDDCFLLLLGLCDNRNSPITIIRIEIL